MSKEYKMISEFCCCGKPMVTVMIGNAAHVMSQEEWCKVCGSENPYRQKTKVAWKRFVASRSYNQSKVS